MSKFRVTRVYWEMAHVWTMKVFDANSAEEAEAMADADESNEGWTSEEEVCDSDHIDTTVEEVVPMNGRFEVREMYPPGQHEPYIPSWAIAGTKSDE